MVRNTIVFRSAPVPATHRRRDFRPLTRSAQQNQNRILHLYMYVCLHCVIHVACSGIRKYIRSLYEHTHTEKIVFAKEQKAR